MRPASREALLVAWERGLSQIATALGKRTAVELWAAWPGLRNALVAADAAQGHLSGQRPD